MQTAQGLNTATCTDDTYVTATKTYTQVGLHDFRDPACMPNITQQQYTSIVASGGGLQTDWQFLLGAAGANKAVNLCRRVATSGSQAFSNAHFLRNPCARNPLTGGQLGVAGAADSTAATATATSGIRIIESSGTSDVKKCLNLANDNATPYFAIGVISAENNPFDESLTDRDSYRFVKLDGVSPENAFDDRARQNAINGDYAFAAEMTAFTANTASFSGRDMIHNISTRRYTDVFSNLRGLFISPGSGYPDHPTFPTQVHKGTKFGANCSPWNLFW